MSEATGPIDFGRVEADGTVYVRTEDGERRVGQVPDVTPGEAMAFFVRRFNALQTEVDLLDKRIRAGAVSPAESRKSVAALITSVSEANAVGDLAGLVAQLNALEPVIEDQSNKRKEERQKLNEQTRAQKEKMVAEAEKLANGNDWRGGVNKFRNLLDEWKKLPHLDKISDDELWHKFSSARTTYTRRRKAQFAEWNVQHAEAAEKKEAIIKEAEALARSTDWSNTAADFRNLMARWKQAGSAGRDQDDKLWAKFRGLQDQFFDARNAVLNEQEAEYQANAKAKEALLDEWEPKLLPVTDVHAARAALREFLTKYNEYGRVPRNMIAVLDDRVHKIDQAIHEAEENEWRRTDPQAKQLAQDTVNMFTEQIAKLEKQLEGIIASGDEKKAAKLQESITTYTEWRDQAAKTLAEFK
jgi:actin-related protein